MYKVTSDYIISNKIENLSSFEKQKVYMAMQDLEYNGININAVRKLQGISSNKYTYRVTSSFRLIFEVIGMEIRIVDIVFQDTLDYFRNSFEGVNK